MRTHRTCLAALILIAATQIYAAAPSVTPLSPTLGGFTASATPALTFSIQSDAAIVTLSAVLDGALISATHNTNGTWSLNPSSLTDGTHCYTITIIDANNQPGSTIVTFYNDLSHPVVTITSPSNLQSVVGPDVPISGTFSGLNHRQIGSITVQVNPGTTYPANVIWLDDHSGIFYTTLPEASAGWYVAHATITSPSGIQNQTGVVDQNNVCSNPDINFKVFDRPCITFTNNQGTYWNGTNYYGAYYNIPQISGTYTSDGSYWLSSYVLTDNKGVAPGQTYLSTYNMYNGYFTFTGNMLNNIPIPDGEYNAEFTFTLSDGSTVRTDETIYFDTHPPDFAYIAPSATPLTLANGTSIPVLYGSTATLGVNDSGSGIAAVYLIQTVNPNLPYYGWNQAPAAYDPHSGSISMTGLTTGWYDYSVYAYDKLGNIGVFEWIFLVDNSPPTISLPPTQTFNNIPFLELTCTTQVPLATAGFTLTDAKGTVYGGGSLYASTYIYGGCDPLIADGTYTLTATATDIAGLTGIATSIVIIDRTPLQFAYANPANANTPLHGPVASLSISDPPDASGLTGSGINWDSVVVYDNAASQVITWYRNGTGIELHGMINGNHSYLVTAHDNAGNSASFNWNFTVTAPAPTLTVIGPDYYSYDQSTTISATLSDPFGIDLNSVQVYIDDVLSEQAAQSVMVYAANGNVTSLTFTNSPVQPLLDGDHVIRVVASNLAGVQLDTSDWTYTLDTTPPSASFIYPGSDNKVYERNPTLAVTVSDAASGLNYDLLQVYVVNLADNFPIYYTPSYDYNGNVAISLQAMAEGDYELHAVMTDYSCNWQSPNNGCNNVDQVLSFTVDLHTIQVTIETVYGNLPSICTAHATQGGDDITNLCNFSFTVAGMTVTTQNGNQADIAADYPDGAVSISVEATLSNDLGALTSGTGSANDTIAVITCPVSNDKKVVALAASSDAQTEYLCHPGGAGGSLVVVLNGNKKEITLGGDPAKQYLVEIESKNPGGKIKIFDKNGVEFQNNPSVNGNKNQSAREPG